MNITSAQKDAIKRKVVALINEAESKTREKAKNAYVLPENYRHIMTKLSKLEELQKEIDAIVEELDMDSSCYTYVFNVDNIHCSFNRKNAEYTKEFLTTLKNVYAGKVVADMHFPTPEEISDDIELQTLDKNFDLKSFIDKYELIVSSK